MGHASSASGLNQNENHNDMKIRGPLFASLIVFGATILVSVFPKPQDSSEKETVLMRTILTFVDQIHFRPKEINNDLSQEFHDLYLDRIDAGRRFLTQEDIGQLEVYALSLDEAIQEGDTEFFDLSVQLLEQGLEKTQAYYREALVQPFDFEVNETYESDGKKRDFAANDEALKDYWYHMMKYEVLIRLKRKLDNQEEAGEEKALKPFEQLEKEAREKVLEVYDDWYSRMKKLKRSDRLSVYLNTFTHLMDPHTDYLEPIDKENFNIRFSGQLEGIGARLTTEGEFTKVAEVVVGGPAWQGKDLEEGDLILKVAQDKNGDYQDVTGWVLDDVVQLIRGKKGTIVRLWVKKVDGTSEEITIERDVVIFEEGYAKSLILDGPEKEERIGYIYLPRFYANFEDNDGRFSAEDVEKEIEKLKEEQVNGIILDLRNNGGGSLRDVVRMSGFFIEKGPIVQVKSREGKPEVLADSDARVQYDGPLVVLVNNFSASASEILAAALQDYERAVIVGAKSTFGKGTVQRFFNLDRALRGYDEVKPLGEIKLTTQKFYRINGGSTQLRGVTPDIILPDNYYYIEVGEREEEYAMEWTKIDPVPYNQNVYRVEKVEELRRRSAERVAQNEVFQKIFEGAKRLEERQEESTYPLNMDEYIAYAEANETEAEKYEGLFDQDVNEGVRNLELDLESIHADPKKEERNQDFIGSVAKDVYIQEALHILHDLISLNN